MHLKKWSLAACAASVVAAGWGAPARADVKLPAVLSDHMVLQQQQPVPIWGTADKGEEVTVAFEGQKQTAKAGDDGNWQVKLTPLTASDKPATLTVSGKNTIELKDILVGEVWICSGQSNMEFGIKNAKNSDKEVAAANYQDIRLFTVPKSVQEEPQSDLKVQPPAAGEWLHCTPQNVGAGGWGGFTAVGYFFGRDLHKALHVPVGLIHTSWGGTVAEAWTSHKALESDADFKPILERGEKQTDEGYQKELSAWKEATAKAKAAGKRPPNKPRSTINDPNRPSVLFNGMITPIVPFAIRGVIWYQGESNANRAAQYRKLLPAMIQSWRETWDQAGDAHDFPFLIVQLANFQNPPTEPGESDWAELREAQAMTAAMPHNGEALAIDLADVNNPGDIHPKDKQDVGKRLELVALAKVYGKKIEYAGPIYDSMKIEGNKIKIHFKHAEGMTAKGGESLKGFQIAGADKKWVWADAKIDAQDGDVIVSSDKVEKPVAVRYDWANNPQGNLYNKADLPATPFRTDTWAGITAGRK